MNKGKCKIRFLRNDPLYRYYSAIESKNLEFTCVELRLEKENLKSIFRKKNKTDEVIQKFGKDSMYDEYCKQIDKILENCNCKYHCPKCSQEDNEFDFCRCLKTTKEREEKEIS